METHLFAFLFLRLIGGDDNEKDRSRNGKREASHLEIGTKLQCRQFLFNIYLSNGSLIILVRKIPMMIEE